MYKNSLTLPMRAVALAVGAFGLLAGGVAHAAGGEAKLPFYLSASQTLTRDSNFSRTDTPQAETVSSTAALFGFSKDYGRQQYDLSTQYSINRYAHYKELLNNDAKSMNGSVSSQFLANWQLSLGGSYSQSLNAIKDNVTAERVVKNIRTYNDRNVSLRYGLDALWSLTLTGSANTVRYSQAAYKIYDTNQRSTSVRVNYYPADTLVFGLAYRPVSTHYISNLRDYTISDRNVDLSTNWMVSGLSRLNATLTRRNSTYSNDDMRNIRSWSGNLGWNYTPGGMFSYNLGASRYTGTDRTDNLFAGYSADQASQRTDIFNLSTNYSASMAAALTAKTSVRMSYSLSKNRYRVTDVKNISETATLLNLPLSDFLCGASGCSYLYDVKSVQHTTGLTFTYAPIRSVSTQCDLQAYSQTRDQYGRRFQGRSLSCSVSATLDSLSPLFDGWFE